MIENQSLVLGTDFSRGSKYFSNYVVGHEYIHFLQSMGWPILLFAHSGRIQVTREALKKGLDSDNNENLTNWDNFISFSLNSISGGLNVLMEGDALLRIWRGDKIDVAMENYVLELLDNMLKKNNMDSNAPHIIGVRVALEAFGIEECGLLKQARSQVGRLKLRKACKLWDHAVRWPIVEAFKYINGGELCTKFDDIYRVIGPDLDRLLFKYLDFLDVNITATFKGDISWFEEAEEQNDLCIHITYAVIYILHMQFFNRIGKISPYTIDRISLANHRRLLQTLTFLYPEQIQELKLNGNKLPIFPSKVPVPVINIDEKAVGIIMPVPVEPKTIGLQFRTLTAGNETIIQGEEEVACISLAGSVAWAIRKAKLENKTICYCPIRKGHSIILGTTTT